VFLKNTRLFTLLMLAGVLLSGWSWFAFSYPRFAVIDLSVGRDEALKIASDYLRTEEQKDPAQYLQAIVFSADTTGDRYLQKAIGFEEEEKFIAEHKLDLFVWLVRFMQEGKKEEYRIAVSSKTGEVISVGHQLDEAAARTTITEETAQKKAEDFLRQRFSLDFNNYAFHSKSVEKFDNRREYTFYWEKKNIYIPWSPEPNTGGARLLTSVEVSGESILKFSKQIITPPDEFNRYIESKKESGRNLGLISNIFSLAFLIASIWVVVTRRNHLAMNATKRFYIGVTSGIFLLGILSGLNQGQLYVGQYPTTQPFIPYIVREIIFEIINRFFMIACLIIPCLAGELMHFEVFPKNKEGGFFHYVTTTFLSREVSRSIVLGYAFAVVMIGFQAAIFEFGFRHLGVWIEQTRLNQLSSSYFPFLAALTIGVNASFAEESLFRLFGISFGAKLFKNLFVAVLFSALVWGLGHTGYMVFPFWFRGLEVTLLGLFMSAIYLRFGLICVIVVHFLFDAFWGSSPYIFGNGDVLNFSMSILILSLPLMIALIAYLKNRPVVEKLLEWRLNVHQKFNVEILKGFILRRRAEPNFASVDLRRELIGHGWDVAVIEVALKQLNIALPVENERAGA